MATYMLLYDPVERFFNIEKSYPVLLDESDHGTSDAYNDSPEWVAQRLRERVPVLGCTKAPVVTNDHQEGSLRPLPVKVQGEGEDSRLMQPILT